MSIPDSPSALGHHCSDGNAPFLSRHLSEQLASDQSECTDCPDSELFKGIRLRLLITLTATLLSFEIGGQMITGPMVRVIETIACDNYWRRHDPARLPATGHLPEHLCKLAAVQREVATVKVYSDLLEGLLCAICAIPYGILADRYGRRAIRLTIPGFLLNALIINSVLWFSEALPLRVIWLAAFSWIIGGGPAVTLIVIWTMLADLTSDAQRATLFFRVGLASQVASFFASAIISGLMTLNPWIPLMIGCGIVMIGLSGAFSLPETMNIVVKTSSSATACSDGSFTTYETSHTSEPAYQLLLRKMAPLIRPYLFIFNRHLLLLLFSFATAQVAQTSSSFLTQYMPDRFNWTLARAHLLTSLNMAVTIPVFLFLLHTCRTKSCIPCPYQGETFRPRVLVMLLSYWDHSALVSLPRAYF